MNGRHGDGSAGDVDYGRVRDVYSRFRRPDPAIAAFLDALLGDARTLLNVGAGAGSYEPVTRTVTAVEPSASMRAQRPPHLPTAIDAVAESLPFAKGSFDAAMTTFSVHQWSDPDAGLREMRRVARGPVLVMTCDPDEVERFWLNDYCPEVLAAEARRYPGIDRIAASIGKGRVLPVPIPLACEDGFNEAYYGRPEMLLRAEARVACSAWSFVEPSVSACFERDLGRALTNGEWDARFGHLRRQPVFEGSLKVVIGRP